MTMTMTTTHRMQLPQQQRTRTDNRKKIMILLRMMHYRLQRPVRWRRQRRRRQIISSKNYSNNFVIMFRHDCGHYFLWVLCWIVAPTWRPPRWILYCGNWSGSPSNNSVRSMRGAGLFLRWGPYSHPRSEKYYHPPWQHPQTKIGMAVPNDYCRSCCVHRHWRTV